MQFTPADTRREQVSAAESLLLEVDPTKAYPLEFVVFRVTGYHPKTPDAGDLLTGLALQHDLGLLVEQVSDSLDEQTEFVTEPVLQINDVAERFNVTSKTIQRWRRRGLAARKFIFPDGKRRVGFLLSSVERFLARNGETVVRGANFSQVDDAERDEIIRRARRLAVGCQCCVNEITRRLARKMNRSPLTILHTIRRFDEQHPGNAVFPQAAEPLADMVRLRIVRAHRQGQSIRTLARRWCRPRTAIYRVIVDERAAKLARRKVRFIDDPLYHDDQAEQYIEDLLNADVSLSGSAAEPARVPRDLPAYLQELYRTPLLTPARERALFIAFNYRKFRFVQARHRMEPQFARARELDELESLLDRATMIKNQIVAANLRLVVSVARKHLRPNIDLMELISEGNVTLMRAVESFDIHKGVRFSTYATLALMKGFARAVPAMQVAIRRQGGGNALLDQVVDRRSDSRQTSVADRDQVQQMLGRLSERERRVISAHFGIESAPAMVESRRGQVSYDQLAEQLGLSKQRVRQIERAALNKLRTAAGVSPAD